MHLSLSSGCAHDCVAHRRVAYEGQVLDALKPYGNHLQSETVSVYLSFTETLSVLSIHTAPRKCAALKIFSKTGENNGKRIWRDFNHRRGVVRRESARQTDLSYRRFGWDWGGDCAISRIAWRTRRGCGPGLDQGGSGNRPSTNGCGEKRRQF